MKAWLKDKLSELKADLRRAHTSWTVRFGVMAELLIEYMPEITRAVTDSENYMLPETYKRIMQGIVLVNIALRFKTNKALRNK